MLGDGTDDLTDLVQFIVGLEGLVLGEDTEELLLALLRDQDTLGGCDAARAG